MFWSKIWLFIVAAVAAIAVTVALLMPRPAERSRALEERDRLVVACDVVNILLKNSARSQVDVAGIFARTGPIVDALAQAGAADTIADDKAKAARKLATDTIAAVGGTPPDFAVLIDRRGRVLARAGLDEAGYGDTMAGRALIDDALTGYLRDDLWYLGGQLYRVAASPVVRRDAPVAYVGAVVIGTAIGKQLAEQVVSPLSAKISFYADGKLLVSSSDEVLDRDLLAAYQPLASSRSELTEDCKARQPFTARAGDREFTALVARLPGEARAANAFFGVYLERPAALGLLGTIDAVRKDDLSFGHFPWVAVGLGFLLAIAIGLALMILEADRPVRRLQADAVALASGTSERLPEDRHGGRYGSIARSVNIRVDKIAREARNARRNLDQLLGPGDDAGGLGVLDLDAGRGAGASRSDAPARPPPPAEFRFSGAPPTLDLSGPAASGPAMAPSAPAVAKPPSRPAMPAAPPARPVEPPPVRAPEPPPRAPEPPPAALDDDILDSAPLGGGEDDAYFRSVFDEFVAMKRHCGEPTAGLTYPRFAEKLRRNRDDLMAKPGCVDVRFSVYVKDGKAALKATPVKDG